MNAIVSVREIGPLARAALVRSGGHIEPIAGFEGAPYRHAAGDVVWVGATPRLRHPRMVVVDRVPAPRATAVGFTEAAIWTPPSLALEGPARARLAANAVRFAAPAFLAALGAPRGFGAALAGTALPFPLDLAAKRMDALVLALDAADDAALAEAAVGLLGVGNGLTPSGDDLVSALCFARRALGTPAPALTSRLLDAARDRTHAISAALFADTLAGATYGPLVDVVRSLAQRTCEEAIEPARALVAIGHSSGWDLLAGLLLGLGARARRPARSALPASEPVSS